MKTIFSVCILTALLYSCTNDGPMGPLDCMRVENGTAIIDDCGDCHKWLAYNTVTHVSREVNDTINEVLLDDEIFTTPNNPMNSAWNFCPDCNGISHGPALIDSCRDCQLAYIYNFITHEATFIDDTAGVIFDPTTQMIGMPDHPQNPYWNAGCQ